jgi:hypothetical protein
MIRDKSVGFGLNFYGSIWFAASWVSAYFAWAYFVNKEEKRK